MMMLIAQPSLALIGIFPQSRSFLGNVSWSLGDVVEISDHLAFRSFVGPL